MALSIYDHAKLSQNPLSVAALMEVATSDQLFSMLPFVPKEGEGFDYTREVSTGSFAFIADDYASTITESTGEDERVHVPKREAAADFYVDLFSQLNQSAMVSAFDRQALKKFKAAGRTLAENVINGGYVTGFTAGAFPSGDYVDALVSAAPYQDSNRFGPGSLKYTHTGTFLQYRAPGDRDYGTAVACASDGSYTLTSDNPSKWIRVTLDVSDATADLEVLFRLTSSTNEFDGLINLVSLAQTRSSVGANGDAYAYAILDELIDAVKVRQNLAFIMHSKLVRKHMALDRGLGGATVGDLPNNAGVVPTYRGIPLLANDWIGTAETKAGSSTLSSVYLASLSAEEGLWMGALGGAANAVQASPKDAIVLGFNLQNLGPIQAAAGNRIGGRLSWFGGLALGSTLSAARAKEIETV